MSEVSYRDYVMSVERVEARLRRTCTALEGAGMPYAVIGGNAVGAWVARADPSAVRATRDVDLLVRRQDLPGITRSLVALGFLREDLRDLVLFTDPEEPSRRAGIHLVWAGEKVRPSYSVPAPQVHEVVRDPSGFWVLDLPALVRMKLTSFRDVDRVHLSDMLSVGLITPEVKRTLPAELLDRLDALEKSGEQ